MFPVCFALLRREWWKKRRRDFHARVDNVLPLNGAMLTEEVQVICWFGLERGLARLGVGCTGSCMLF